MFYSSCIARVRWVGVWVCLCMFEFVIKVKIKSEWEFVNVKFAWRNNIRETEREKRYGVTWHLLLLPFSRGYKNEFKVFIWKKTIIRTFIRIRHFLMKMLRNISIAAVHISIGIKGFRWNLSVLLIMFLDVLFAQCTLLSKIKIWCAKLYKIQVPRLLRAYTFIKESKVNKFRVSFHL